MPEGIVRTDLNATADSFKNGTPIVLPKEFGTAITEPESFGNPHPANDPSFDGNPVDLPKDFGNLFTGPPA